MKALFLSLLAVITFAACNKTVVPPGTPPCVEQMIKENRDDENWFYGKVEEYEFQGKLVYAFQPDNRIIADGATRILSDACNEICYVGGFGGPDIMKCNGVNFYDNAVLKRVIWSKY